MLLCLSNNWCQGGRRKKKAMDFFLPTAFRYIASHGKELPCPCSSFKGAYGQTDFVCHHQFLLENFIII